MAQKITKSQIRGGDYSTSEVDTGSKWIDGSTIYKKTIDFGAIPSDATKTVAHNITGLSSIVNFEAMMSTGSSYFPLPFARTGGTDSVELRFNTTVVDIRTTTANFSSYSAYVTVYYTKT